MKRFWTQATPVLQDGQYQVLLDQRPVKLPSGAALTVPFAPLADGIAQEWSAAGEIFSPHDLPLTQFVCTAQERVALHRPEIIRQLVAYGLNDLLCYRADTPPHLVARQQASWDPWLRWLEATHDIALITTHGLMPVTQLPWTDTKLTALLTPRSAYQLAALGVLVPALGSFVLGLAVADGQLAPEQACEAAMLDELWQAEQWGDDPVNTAKRQAVLAELEHATRFLQLLGA